MIAAPNEPPIAVDDIAMATQGVEIIISVLANDTDPENDGLTILSISEPLNGTAELNGDNIFYTPNIDFVGNDSFSYTITDGVTGNDVTAMVVIGVTASGINEAPTANLDQATTEEGVAVSYTHLTLPTTPYV